LPADPPNRASPGQSIALCHQKCLAARSPSRTAPETADTMTMFIRFCAAIDITGAAEVGDGPGLEGFRFGFFAVALVRIAIPERWRVRPLGSLTLTLSLPRFAP